MGIKSLRDFAAENGVTVRAVQKHIAKYADELEGHLTRYGAPRGTYLDEYAQEFIAGHFVKDPIAVIDNSLSDENERLKAELEAANKRIISLLEERTALTERALQAEAHKAIAEASQQDQERRTAEAETRAQQLEDELATAKERAAEAEAETMKLKSRSLWQRITRWGER